MVLTAGVELLGIGLLFPYIKILGNQSIIHQNHFLNHIYVSLNFQNTNSFLIFIGIGIFFMILLKGGMAVFNNYFQTRFTSKLNVRLSHFCFKNYLSMPYADLLSKNSSVLSKHLLVDVMYAVLVLTAILSVATDVIVTMALVSLMLFIDLKLILVVTGILILFLLFCIKGTKKIIRKLGNQNEFYNQKMFKVSSDALQGLKDVKVHRVENFFLNRYMHWRIKTANNLITYNVVSNIPATTMNIMGFGLLLAILLYLMFTHGSLVAVLPIIGIIAICVQRMMPAASRISIQLGIIRQYQSNVMIVKNAIDMMKKANGNQMIIDGDDQAVLFSRYLSLHHVDYTYPGCKEKALSDISLTLKKGSSLGIVGASGAGKSTLVDLLLGLLPIQNGEIVCDDINISQQDYTHLYSLMGYVPQQTYLIDGSIKENIAFGVEQDDIVDEAIKRSITISQLESFIDGLPDGLDTLIGERGIRLSGGQRQRIGIARALYNDPEIIIMDEATNALDSVTETEFNEALKTLMGKKTLIIIAHRHTSVKFCDELIILDQGCIVGHGSHEVLSEQSVLYRELYRLDLPENV